MSIFGDLVDPPGFGSNRDGDTGSREVVPGVFARDPAGPGPKVRGA